VPAVIDVRKLTYEERRTLRGALGRELAFQHDRRALASNARDEQTALDRCVLIGNMLAQLAER